MFRTYTSLISSNIHSRLAQIFVVQAQVTSASVANILEREALSEIMEAIDAIATAEELKAVLDRKKLENEQWSFAQCKVP